MGNGRPFTLEIVAPKTPFHEPSALSAAAIQVNACGLIEIDGLTECDLNVVGAQMKEGEEGHRKEYRCCVQLSRPLTPADITLLNGTKELVCHQNTP